MWFIKSSQRWYLFNTKVNFLSLRSSYCLGMLIYLKGGGHAKKVFLILVSNGQLKCEIMKYAFLKFLFLNYTIK